MNKSPIIIIEDDHDDIDIIQYATKRLEHNRPILFFTNGTELVDFLTNNQVTPFLIICDLNLPGENGFALKRRIDGNAQVRYKGVPFVYWSTNATQKEIQHAYDLPAQGFFFKPNTIEALQDTLELMIRYWETSEHPKKVI